MTNEEMLGVADIVERATNRFNAQAAVCRERRNEYDKLIASMKADHEAKMVEHRAAFGARTEADAKIIAGLRADIDSLKREELATNETLKPLVDRVVKERDGLLTQVQDMRAEMERLREDERKAYQAGVSLRAEVAALQERLRSSIARGDFAQMEVAALKSQTPKQHPVKVGEYVKDIDGAVAQVREVHKDWYLIARGYGWTFANCEPCDPPEAMHAEPDLTHLHIKGKEAWSDVPNATQWVEEMRGNTEAAHDTDAGKVAAESAASEPIKVGDVIEVFQITGSITYTGDIGARGVIEKICSIDDTAMFSSIGGVHWVSICDVRKVTAAAESAVRTEPVAEEIKVGDVAKVVGASGDLTAQSDIGKIGEVLKIDFGDGTVLLSGGAGWVNRCDVRKVTTLKTEPVVEEIKVGDVVEVVSNIGRNTWLTDVGSVGTVTSIETLEDSLSVRLKAVPDKKNVCGGYVSICDVRKVTT